MKILEITYDDLNEEAQQNYLDFIEADDESDVNTEIPIAILEVEIT